MLWGRCQGAEGVSGPAVCPRLRGTHGSRAAELSGGDRVEQPSLRASADT